MTNGLGRGLSDAADTIIGPIMYVAADPSILMAEQKPLNARTHNVVIVFVAIRHGRTMRVLRVIVAT